LEKDKDDDDEEEAEDRSHSIVLQSEELGILGMASTCGVRNIR
jgi:hypothetical protein